MSISCRPKSPAPQLIKYLMLWVRITLTVSSLLSLDTVCLCGVC